MSDGPENYAQEKLLELEALAERIAEHRAAGEIVGLCHGCFDILHLGHLRHFIAAREQCDRLVVTVTPDRFVGKGPDRPVFAAEHRAELIAGLAVVSYVGVNRWPSAVETLRLLKPSRYFKGREYDLRPEQVNPNFLLEAEAVREAGGEVAFTDGFVLSSSAAWSRVKSSV
ncbi:MAG: adenylyltransferase/cytidyltransferase family protein [Myxococcales bacterium]|nr:adenylyltransferase/cytidyltransferase family protein [Myxococcales bacterium]MCB9750558.1 adenylyltransferase/cytidyltransferase family protein [Myxococcales bacterium]